MSALSPLLFVVLMQEATRAAKGEGLWDLYADELVILVITGESEEAYRKFGVWKNEMETRGKVKMRPR